MRAPLVKRSEAPRNAGTAFRSAPGFGPGGARREENKGPWGGPPPWALFAPRNRLEGGMFVQRRAVAAASNRAGLAVSVPSDPAEREAEAIAARVLAPAAPVAEPVRPLAGGGARINRKCASCEEEEDRPAKAEGDTIHRRGEGVPEPPAIEAAVGAIGAGGEPLPSGERRFFEDRLGFDLSRVRVHADRPAAEAARALHAEAFTLRNDVAFAEGRYEPGSARGRNLLAHELVHVVQQGGAPALAGGSGLVVGDAAPARIARKMDTEAVTGPPRSAGSTAQTAPATAETATGGGLLAEDEAQTLVSGQMRKSAFLAELRAAACAIADRELERAGRDTRGCPHVERLLDIYAHRPAVHVERVLRKFAPGAASARSARELIAPVAERLARGVRTWVETGKMPDDIPPEVQADVAAGPGAGAGGPLGGALSAVGSVIGGALSAVGRLFFKGAPGGARAGADVAALSTRLGPGRPLDASARGRMETAFGRSFDRVRVHDDQAAAGVAGDLRAHAFTLGEHVAFASGAFKPGTPVGDALLAHELAHVEQQSPAVAAAAPAADTDLAKRPASAADAAPDAFERDADATAAGAMVTLWGGRPAALASLPKEAQAIATDAAGRASRGKRRSGARLPALTLQRCAHNAAPPAAAAPAGPAPTPLSLPGAMPAAGPGDFQIDHERTSEPKRIFFGRGASNVDADDQSKIDAFKVTSPGAVKVIGYTSADEPAALALARANAVKAALTAAPNPVAVSSATGNAGALSDQSDFASARSAEIVVGHAAPAAADCGKKDSHGHLVHPPKQACAAMDPPTLTAFNEAHTIAKQSMAAAKDAVTRAGGPNGDEQTLIDKFFGAHDAATLATLKTNLSRLKDHVDDLPAHTQCGGSCDTGGCAQGPIAYNLDVDAASTMTLCVPTFKSLAVNDRARNLIHESAHGTTPLGGPAAPTSGTEDVGYRHERIITQLSTSDTLRNSDSYALFAIYLREVNTTHDPHATPAGISKPASDDYVGFTGPAAGDAAPMRLALAKLEKRLTWAQDWMGQLYGGITKLRKAPPAHHAAPTWSDVFGQSLMAEVSRGFPVTAPPALPTATDQARVAAIVDRYAHMRRSVKTDLTVTRVAAGVASWAAGGASSTHAGDRVAVGPDFFRATPEDQISLLLQALAFRIPDVESDFVPAYVSLAAWIHRKNP